MSEGGNRAVKLVSHYAYLPSRTPARFTITEPQYRRITTAAQGANLIVAIQEKVLRDTPTCYAIRDEIVAAIDAAAPKNLVLDRACIEFVGSIGILAFLGLGDAYPRAGSS